MQNTIRLTPILLFCGLLSACGNTTKPETSNQCREVSPSPIHIEGQDNFTLGSFRGYPEERPRQVNVSAFNIDTNEVTNAQFKAFIDATGYVTTAEKLQTGLNVAGAAVFKSPTASNPSWWQFIEGANWRHPEGPNSSIAGRDYDPVVQVSLIDAKAYAKWAGRAIPSEAQWEYAARGGTDTLYVWGDQRAPSGQEKANTWQGAFPIKNNAADGYTLRAPIGCYDANGYGLYDMVGNVWEWTVTEYESARAPNSYAIKGGSFLCAENYCARYRAPARQSQEADFSTNHIGFRTVSLPAADKPNNAAQ